MRKWRIEDSEELYNIKGWGASYFGINDKGHVVVTPLKDGVESRIASNGRLRSITIKLRTSSSILSR